MALSSQRRKMIPPSSFVYPAKSATARSTSTGGKSTGLYPIDTKARARAALGYAGRKDTAGSYAAVERAVNRRYPDIKTRHHTPKRKR
jgi:hypothetical protein